MPFQIQTANILTFQGDAIIHPVYRFFNGYVPLDYQIYRKGGPLFYFACSRMKLLRYGKAAITRSGKLACRYVIHTAVPGKPREQDEEIILRRCYRNSFALAAKRGLKTIAVPLIGADQRDLINEGLLTIAKEEISAFLASHDDTYILLVVPHKSDIEIDNNVLYGLNRFIRFAQEWESSEQRTDFLNNQGFGRLSSSDNTFKIIARKESSAPRRFNDPNVMHSIDPKRRRFELSKRSIQRRIMLNEHRRRYKETVRKNNNAFYDALPDASVPSTEEKADNNFNVHCSSFEPERGAILDESFSEMVMRKIDERGFKKDSECYSKANIDRKLFSHIRCDKQYHPKKTTALALAVALELSLSETNELLMKAGYSLSPSILSDMIVEYCIRQKIYDIFEINKMLFKNDQALLGG